MLQLAVKQLFALVTYSLSFHQNFRFSKTLSRYQEQPHPLFVFLDPPKKMHMTVVGYSLNIQGIFLYSIICEHYFGNIPRNFIGNFFRIYREYIMGMFHKYYTNIYLPGGKLFRKIFVSFCNSFLVMICRI